MADTVDRQDPVQELLDRVGKVARDSQGLVRQLAGSERRFRALAKAVWQVQEEERRRLARELHDGLGQELTALKNLLEQMAGEAGGAGAAFMAAKLASAVELAARALHDTRELSRLLRPPILDDLGLLPALSWLTRTLRESAGLEVRVAGDGIDGRLDPDLEIRPQALGSAGGRRPAAAARRLARARDHRRRPRLRCRPRARPGPGRGRVRPARHERSPGAVRRPAADHLVAGRGHPAARRGAPAADGAGG